MREVINLSGQKFTKLLVLKQSFVKRHNRIAWKCLCDCGNVVVITGTALKSKNTRSCGCIHKTQLKERNKKYSGENSPTWNKNLSLRERYISKTRNINPKFIKWRKAVFQRDNYTCQITQKKERNLAAHHLYSWNKYLNLRFDINNGITLSAKIHKLFHRLYKKGNNTKEQFEEFKNRYKKGEFNNIV